MKSHNSSLTQRLVSILILMYSCALGLTISAASLTVQSQPDAANLSTMSLIDNSLVTVYTAKLTADDAADSEAAKFGNSVAVSEDGDTIVVGSYLEDHDDMQNAGAAYVFERNHGGLDKWGQVAKLTSSDAEAHNSFGSAVAISGDTIVVGAYRDDLTNDWAGSAYVFERNHGGPDNWGQVQKLTPNDASSWDEFGVSVDISGDTIVVGSYNDTHVTLKEGSAYVFERNTDGADNWGQVQKLVADAPQMNHRFGYAVSINTDADTIVVGAYGDDEGEDWSGAAYIFARNQGGADNWGQVQKLKADTPEENAHLGRSVSINGDTAVIGTFGGDGAAYVFERNQGGADNWGQAKKLTTSDADANAKFGNAVAISGDTDTIVVGAFYDSAFMGSAFILERNYGGPDNWGQVKKLTSGADASASDFFGSSVALSDGADTVVIGSPEDDPDGIEQAGSAYAFARHGVRWTQIAKSTTGAGAAEADYFGFSVAISGDTAVVGAHLDDHDSLEDAGSAYVLARNQGGGDSWDIVQTLTAGVDASADDYFGYAVAISEDANVIVIGARYGDSATTDSGAAFVFERNQGGADNWGRVQKLTSADAAATDDFGVSVAISGDTVVIGAPGNGDAGQGSGSAYVFARNQGSADNWGQVKKLTAGADAAEGDHFGQSVAISGDTAVIGAYYDDHSGETAAGSAYVFERNQGGTAENWGQVKKLIAEGAATGDWFGHAVAIHGNIIVVGAPLDNDSVGSLYVFERNQDGIANNWGQVERLAANDGAGGDYLGWSAAVSSDKVVASAYEDDDAGSASGAAYIFARNQDGADTWGQVQKLTALDAAEGDHFGKSVAISGATVVIGANLDDDGASAAGSVYAFRWAAAKIYAPLIVKQVSLRD